MSVLQPIWFRIPETARKVKRRVRQVMQWAKGANLYVGENPVDAASGSLPRHQAGEVQHYPALPYQEMPVFMADLIGREGIAVLALRFLTAGSFTETSRPAKCAIVIAPSSLSEVRATPILRSYVKGLRASGYHQAQPPRYTISPPQNPFVIADVG